MVSYKVNGKEHYTKITQPILSAISSPFAIIAIKHAEVKTKAMIGREIDIFLDVFSFGIYKDRIKNEILNFLITILNICIIFVVALIIILVLIFNRVNKVLMINTKQKNKKR